MGDMGLSGVFYEMALPTTLKVSSYTIGETYTYFPFKTPPTVQICTAFKGIAP